MIVVASLVLLLVAINVAVAVAVARSEAYEPTQKRLQFLLIWLLPIVGSALAWYLLRDEAKYRRMSSEGGNENLWWNYPDDNEGSPNSHEHQGGH